jgi:hypothetical protein
MVEISGFNRDLPVHKKCLETLQSVKDAGGDWKLLPEGPLRTEFGAAHTEKEGAGE